MCLADYQKVIVDQIYNLLINDDCNRGITLCGDAGSGKSTIALGVVAQLQEGWSVFYIEGINPGLSPYVWSPISGNSEINPPIDIHLHKAEGFFCISPNGINSMELLRIT